MDTSSNGTGAGKIAFFDVDKTLCDCYSGYYATRELIRLKVIKKRRLAMAMAYKTIGHLFKQMNVRRMYEIALADMAGTQLSEIMSIGERVFNSYVQPTLYQEAIDEIQKRKSQGYFVVLISSGPYMCIRHIEKYVGADQSFSIGPVIENGVLQAHIEEPLCYQEGKVTIAKQLMEQRGISADECCFYSDSYADLPLLKLVGAPYVVNPDRNLSKAAQQKNWPILTFKQKLKD